MVMTNGTAPHGHQIYNFHMTDHRTTDNLIAINGTATVTTRDGPVQDVPVGIQIFNRTMIAVTIGPDKVQSHFGSAPVYGVVSDASKANPAEFLAGRREGFAPSQFHGYELWRPCEKGRQILWQLYGISHLP